MTRACNSLVFTVAFRLVRYLAISPPAGGQPQAAVLPLPLTARPGKAHRLPAIRGSSPSQPSPHSPQPLSTA